MKTLGVRRSMQKEDNTSLSEDDIEEDELNNSNDNDDNQRLQEEAPMSEEEDWEHQIYNEEKHNTIVQQQEMKKKRKRGPTRSKIKRKSRKIQTRITITPSYDIEYKEQRKHQYTANINERTEQIQERRNNVTTQKNNDILSHWGDQLTTNDEWPRVNNRDTLRIFHINMNGISYTNDYIDWEMILGNLQQMQVDIFGITEPNLDFHNKIVQEAIREKTQHFDKYMKLSVSSSFQTVGDTPYKRGGTITGVNGSWSGRMLPEPQQEKLGRWSEAVLGGKDGRKLYIFTVYRTCPYSNTYGGNTIYMQQQRDLLQKKKKQLDPRKEILNNLNKRIQEIHTKGDRTFLLGDFNENIQEGEMKRFMEETNMKNVLLARHGERAKLPATYDKGRHSVDMIAMSNDLDSGAIKRAGCIPFYSFFLTDHCGIFADVDIEKLFAKVHDDTTRTTYKRFTTASVKKCDKYLLELETLMEKSRIFNTVATLKRDMYDILNNKKPRNMLTPIIKKCKDLNIKVTEFMLTAEKRSGKAVYTEGLPYSKQLWDTNRRAFHYKKQLRLIEIGKKAATQEEKEDIEAKYINAKDEFIQAQKIAPELRKQWMQELSQKRAIQWDTKRSDALRVIEETEKVRKSNKRQERWMKPRRHGQLRSLLVPAPLTNVENDIYNIASYTKIDDPTEIFDVLLRRNFHHLLRSQHSIFSRGKVLEACGWYAEGDGATELLKGTMNTQDISKEYTEFPREAKIFLESLKKETDNGGNEIGEYIWQYDTAEFMETFKKTNETTACGPSGLHMSHWKASCERERIAEVHAFFIWAAMQFGFSYNRWEKSWHCMLQKTEWAIYPKLRIIQLFEGDFNAALKYLLGKLLMKYTTEMKILHNDIFGSRKGKTSTEAMITLQLLYDHHRIWHLVIASLFNDAEGCYDRIPANLADICMQRIGCPSSIAHCHTEVQKNMKHYIRIAAGISLGYIAFLCTEKTEETHNNKGNIISIKGKTGGIGQGGGGGPIAWIAVIQVMLLAYSSLCEGVTIEDCLRWTLISIYVVSYVDDNTLLRSFPSTATTTDIIHGITENFTSWNKLLQITGGDLCLEKCEYSVMHWEYDKKGIPYMTPSKHIQDEVVVQSALDPHKGKYTLTRIEPNEANRVLGIRLPMTGNMIQEFEYRCKQADKYSVKLRNAPLNTLDSFMVYSGRYRPMIKYPLPVTLFNEDQCHTIQKKFIMELLPKIGLNRHMPRTLIYGPQKMGGLEIMDLRIEQPVAHWMASMGHMRRMDNTGKALLTTYLDHQIYLGSTHLFHDLDPKLYTYGPSYTRWDYTWKMTAKYGLAIIPYSTWRPELKEDNDANIMDEAVKFYNPHLPATRERLWHINQCRLYLQVFNISDMTSDGTTIMSALINGEISPTQHYQVTFPYTKRPVRYQWAIFEEFIRERFTPNGIQLERNLQLNSITKKKRHHSPQPRPTEEVILRKMYGSVGDIHDMAQWELPESLGCLLETTVMTQSKTLELVQCIKYGHLVGACDGSLLTQSSQAFEDYRPNTAGSYGYILQNADNNNVYVQGCHISPHSNTTSTLTTESFGCIALLTVIHLLSAQGQLHIYKEEVQPIEIGIDNQEVLDRTQTDPPDMNISDMMGPEWDLWKMLRMLIRVIPIPLHFVKVRAHQDVNEKGERIYGPFNLMTTMNMEADKLASKARSHAFGVTIARPLYSYTGMLLIERKTTVQIVNLREYLLHTIHGKNMLEYISAKHNWNATVPTIIDWDGLYHFLKKIGILKRLKMLQLMHNWQNVGAQKKKFNDARANTTKSTTPHITRLQRDEEKCPAQCGELETPLHFMTCKADKMKSERSQLLVNLRTTLSRLDTHPGLIDSAIWCILHFSDKNMATDYAQKLEQWKETTDFETLLRNQKNIGSQSFLKGFITKDWAMIQRKYWNNDPKKRHRINGWTPSFIQAITEVTIGMWIYRNELLHGNTQLETRTRRRQRLQSRIDELYREKEKLFLPADLKVFRKPARFRKKQGPQQMELWIGLAEDTLAIYDTKRRDNPLIRWLTREEALDDGYDN